MKYPIFFAVTLSLAWAPPTPPPFPPGEDAEPAEEELGGEALYLKACMLCHGKEGEGTERGFPLQKPYRPYATEVTRQGRKGNPQFAIPMPAYTLVEVTDHQLAEIWTYLDRFASPQTGAALYMTYCQNCHGRDARGGMTTQALVDSQGLILSPDIFDLWVRWGQDDGFYMSRSSYMPRWNQWEITEQDLQHIKEYLHALAQRATSLHAD